MSGISNRGGKHQTVKFSGGAANAGQKHIQKWVKKGQVSEEREIWESQISTIRNLQHGLDMRLWSRAKFDGALRNSALRNTVARSGMLDRPEKDEGGRDLWRATRNSYLRSNRSLMKGRDEESFDRRQSIFR
jgi:hypothetical protein